MILDYSRNPDGENERRWFKRGRVLVDGVEIKSAWYVDTEAGVVKTYDIFRDGKFATATDRAPINAPFECWVPENFPGREVECPPHGVLSETLRGKVELVFP